MPILLLLPSNGGVIKYAPLKSLTLQLGGGLGKTMSFSGNTLPLSISTIIPSAAPPNGRGIVFYVSGGTLTVYAWTGSAWVT